MRKNGLMAKAEPCTQATSSSSSMASTTSSSVLSLLPLPEVLPISPSQEGYT